jgi:predicted RecA/RadA family phage recombinase
MKFTLFKTPLFFLLAFSTLLICAGLADAGVLHPLALLVPLAGMLATFPSLNQIGSILVREGFDRIRTLRYTHSSATTKDLIYYLNGMILLAQNTALANAENVFICSGLIEFTKVSAQAWTGGQKIYWDDTAQKFTNVYAVGCILAGYAAEPAANPTSTGFVVLSPEMRAASGPSHSIIAAGSSTVENDADASIVISIPGLLTTDVVHANVRAITGVVYVLKAVPTANTLTVILSGNGGAGTIVDYSAMRAVI